VKFLREEQEIDAPQRARLVNLCKEWHRFVVTRELAYLFVLLTIGLYLVLAAGAIVTAATLIVNAIHRLPEAWLNFIPLEAGKAGTVGTVALALAAIVGVQRFLTNYLGDVQMWTTYEEVDERYRKREEVLEHGLQTLHHVLLDPDCDRVVIIAHSLGTAVAQDVLLELGRRSRVREIDPDDPMWKLDLLITMGSPIDKVHYFFESHRGRYHRYNRVVEDLRGDLGTAPFAKNTKRHVHWINIWDKADVISGSIESAANRRKHAFRVDNVEISSLAFPAPAASHSAYFENRCVIEIIFRAIYDGAFSFKTAPRKGNSPPDYESCMAGPGSGRSSTPVYFGAMLAIPWLIAAAVGSHFLGAWMVRDVIGIVLAGVVIALFAAYIITRRRILDPLPRAREHVEKPAADAATA
jgi:hypothetical protein